MELLLKNVVNNIPPNNRTNVELLYDYWNFLKNFTGMIANVAVIDESPTFAVGKAFVQDNDFFVVRAIGEGPFSFQWEAKFQATDNFLGLTPFVDPDDPGPPPPPTDGLFVKLSPSGGWLGFGTGGFGINPTTGNKLVFDGTGLPYEAFFWANGNRIMAVIDLGILASYNNGWYLGKINGVESPVDDPLPCVLLCGIPGRSGAPTTWGSAGYGWQLDPTNAVIDALLDPVVYINVNTQPSKFSGKWVQACIPVSSIAVGSEVFRGDLEGVLAVSSLTDLQKLASNYRVCFNDLSFPWDGTP